MEDEPFDLDSNDSSQESLNEPNGAEIQPVAEQAKPTPPPVSYLSREDFERALSEQDAKWQQRLDETVRLNQAKSDKARDTAIRKSSEFVSDYVPVLRDLGVELTPEQQLQAQTHITNREFFKAQSEAPAPAPAPAWTPPPPLAQPTPTVTRGEVEAYVRAQGVDPGTLDLSKYDNTPRGDATLREELESDIVLAKAEAVKAKRQQQVQRQAARQQEQVKQQYGVVGQALSGGGASAPRNVQAEYDALIAKGPPDDLSQMPAFNKKMRELERLGAT